MADIGLPFQKRVSRWLNDCFGVARASDLESRVHRFLEEAHELGQSAGITAVTAHALVDYTYSRPKGELGQEVGGTMLTLAGLCSAAGVDMVECGEAELERVWGKIGVIRMKEASKPVGSALPGGAAPENTLAYWQDRAQQAEQALRDSVMTHEILRNNRRYMLWRKALFTDLTHISSVMSHVATEQEVDLALDLYERNLKRRHVEEATCPSDSSAE